ncbi:MAG: hypothetical protein Q8Q97_00285 [bacterium]|nr:hypothetical protein [bacterium]
MFISVPPFSEAWVRSVRFEKTWTLFFEGLKFFPATFMNVGMPLCGICEGAIEVIMGAAVGSPSDGPGEPSPPSDVSSGTPAA